MSADAAAPIRAVTAGVARGPIAARRAWTPWAPQSKHWHAFAGPRAPVMDVIITARDNAAGEACPLWPGEPLQLHRGFADPSAATS